MNCLLLVTPVLPGKSQFLPLLATDVEALRQANSSWNIQWQIVFDGPASAEDRGHAAGLTSTECSAQTGVAAGRNIAVDAGLSAGADPGNTWIYPIDADDRLDRAGVSALLAELAAEPWAWVGTSRAFSDGQRFAAFSTNQRQELAAGEFVARHQSGQSVPHPNSLAFRADYFLQLGGWPDLRQAAGISKQLGANHEDLALTLLASDLCSGLWIPEVATKFHYWGGNSTENPEYRRRRQKTFAAAFQYLNAERRRRNQPEIINPSSNHLSFRAEMKSWLAGQESAQRQQWARDKQRH